MVRIQPMVALAALAAVALASSAVAAPAHRGDAHGSSVSISSRVPAFHGRVESGFEPCIDGRRVDLYRKSIGSPPKRIGGDETGSSGSWAIPVENLKAGAYYARAKPRKISAQGDATLCRIARSKLVIVD